MLFNDAKAILSYSSYDNEIRSKEKQSNYNRTKATANENVNQLKQQKFTKK